MKKQTFKVLGILSILIAFGLWTGCKEEVPEPELPTLSISGTTVFEGNDNPSINFQVLASFAIEDDISMDFATGSHPRNCGDFVLSIRRLSSTGSEKKRCIMSNISAFRSAEMPWFVTTANPT